MRQPRLSARQYRLLALIVLFAHMVQAGIREEVHALTNNLHTRIIWAGNGGYLDGGGTITGYDSRLDETRIIRPERSWRRGILCSDGHKIVATSDDWKVFIVDFATGNQQYLVDGFCSSVWKDAQGVEWGFVRDPARTNIRRYRLDNPSVYVHIYTGEAGYGDLHNWYAVSADGTVGVDFLPWSACFFIENAAALNNQPITTRGVSWGCWSSMSSDNSYYWFHLINPHSKILMFHRDKRLREINVAEAINPRPQPPYEWIYHPRFASRGGHFWTFTGFYKENKANDGAEVYFAKFDNDYTRVEKAVRVSYNDGMDSNPDAWVGVGTASQDPMIVLSPDSLSFEAQEGGAHPATKTVTVSSSGGALQGLSVASSQTWLTAMLSGTTINNTVNITGLAAANHTAQVTVSATNASPALSRYTVTLTVRGSSMPTTVVIAPAADTVIPQGTRQLAVSVRDQYGNAVEPRPAVTWSISPAVSGATISTTGLFTAGTSQGQYIVTATAGALEGTARLTVGYKPSTTVITLTPDHKGAVYSVGQTVTIGWEATTDLGTNVRYSQDDGETWILLNKSSVPTISGKGSFTWEIPAEILSRSTVSDMGRFKISDYWNEDVYGISEVFNVAATAVRFGPQRNRLGDVSVRSLGSGVYEIGVPYQGDHRVDIVGLNGSIRASFRGSRPDIYLFRDKRASGMCIMRITTAGRAYQMPLITTW